MPYSPRYLMEQAARGKPRPTGRPEDHLFNALRTANPMDLERAIHMGASPMGARNGRGQSPIQALLSTENRQRANPERVLACVRHLLRYNALAGSGPSVLSQAAAWADSPAIATAWFHLWGPASCRALAPYWQQPDEQGQTPLDHWKAKATAPLLEALDKAFPPPEASASPRRPGLR